MNERKKDHRHKGKRTKARVATWRRRGFLTSCWVKFTSTLMLQILNEIKNNMIKLWSQSTINDQKNQGYISLLVTEIKNSRLHLIACNRNERSALHALHTARHFMRHFTSFHVAFCIISCNISYISSHVSHTSHTRHTCRALCISRTVRISCSAAYVASFYVSFHIILSWNFISHSFIPFRNEESRKRVKTAHSSIERHLRGVFYSRG